MMHIEGKPWFFLSAFVCLFHLALLFIFIFPFIVCSAYLDLNKLCYDFTCLHSGLCSTDGNHAPKCDCLETGYTGERCDKCKRKNELNQGKERISF